MGCRNIKTMMGAPNWKTWQMSNSGTGMEGEKEEKNKRDRGSIEEGRAARKFDYFLSISQQGVSVDIIQNSAVLPKNRRNKDKSS
jgi:hypothetical protein